MSVKMKYVILFVLFFVSCSDNPQFDSSFLLVDVTKNYPLKELVLQDFMDVEYVPLETTDEFLCQGFVQDVTENCIIVRNFSRTGDIFIFDRQGRAVKKSTGSGKGEKNMFCF